MDTNSKKTCICDAAFENGAIKKTIENNVFTIYGNLYKNCTIAVRYHGELIDNICYELYNNNLFIKYYFDDDISTLETHSLAKCCKGLGENYCIDINLQEHNKITFMYFLLTPETNQIISQDNIFNLSITEDILTDILNKHESTALPTIQAKDENNFLSYIEKIIKNLIYKSRTKNKSE